MKTKLVFTRSTSGIGVSLQPTGRFCKKQKLKLIPCYTIEQTKQVAGRKIK